MNTSESVEVVLLFEPPHYLKPLRFILFLVYLWPLALSADCHHWDIPLTKQKQLIVDLKQQQTHLDWFFSGDIKPAFRINNLTNLPLDINYQPNATQKATPQTTDIVFITLQDKSKTQCATEINQWQQQQKEITATESAIAFQVNRFFLLPKSSRLALKHLLTHWETLNQIQIQVNLLTHDDRGESTAQDISQWIERWRHSAKTWMLHLSSNKSGLLQPDIRWQDVLTIPNPKTTLNWPVISQAGIKYDPAWQNTLQSAYDLLTLEPLRWKKWHVSRLDWSTLFQHLKTTESPLQQLKIELLQSPAQFFGPIIAHVIQDLQQARVQGAVWELLSSWFLQSLMLTVLLSMLLKLAALTPSYLSGIQQHWITNNNQVSVIRVATVLFWFLKSNAPWMIVLIGSHVITKNLPERWSILQWLGPIGAIYAGSRALRIILEWLISRTYTRTGQFIPSHVAHSQARDARIISWVMVIGFSAWLLIHQTGGGYLTHIILIFNLLLSWLCIIWLLLHHKKEVSQFLRSVSGHKNRTKATTKTDHLLWLIPLWPPLFLCAHLFDIVISIHQRLMQLDTYRSLNIKLMRIRLEAEAKEETETKSSADSSSSAEGYHNILLKQESNAWIDTHQINCIEQPIQHWQQGLSDDNVLIITGEPGSGKTALVQRLSKNWTTTDITLLSTSSKLTGTKSLFNLLQQHFQTSQINSIDDLIQFDAHNPQQVLIIDTAENLFLSEVGKLEAFRAFNQCLNAHLKNVFWVIVFNTYSWNYLSNVFNREIRFSNIHPMPRWTPIEIRKLILSRHQSSHLRLKYNELLLSASAGSESSSIRAADSRIFNILWEQSNGIPEVALNLWLSAAKVSNHFVEVGVPKKPDSTSLKSLQDDSCFIYAAIIIHRELNTSEVMRVTHYPEPIVRHALKQGLTIGFLRQHSNQRYRIHSVWQSTLTGFLANKNMI